VETAMTGHLVYAPAGTLRWGGGDTSQGALARHWCHDVGKHNYD